MKTYNPTTNSPSATSPQALPRGEYLATAEKATAVGGWDPRSHPALLLSDDNHHALLPHLLLSLPSTKPLHNTSSLTPLMSTPPTCSLIQLDHNSDLKRTSPLTSRETTLTTSPLYSPFSTTTSHPNTLTPTPYQTTASSPSTLTSGPLSKQTTTHTTL